MRPGANSPGPPADPPRTTTTIRPAARWYLLPCALVLAAVVGLLAVVILNFGGLRVLDDPMGIGPADEGARLSLVEGRDYVVYVEDSAAEPSACAVAAAGESRPVALTENYSSILAVPESVGGRSYRYTVSFTSPVTGTAVVTCQGVDGEMMVRPDDTALFYVFVAMLVAGGLTLVAFVVFLIIILRRSAAKRSAFAASPPFKGPYR
jgi:hypothetical protein